MGILDQPLVVLALVALGAAAFWRLTRRGGSAEGMGPFGVDRMDDSAFSWSMRTRERERRDEVAKQRRERA